MAEPSVDVIIPTYNGLPYLSEAVESVLAQTHQTLNLYIVDDGSKDATGEYLKSLTDPRVRALHKENGGLSSARNHGISRSKSEFIALLDADDRWYPRKLEKQLALIQKNPDLGLVYGHQQVIDEAGKPLGRREALLRGQIFDKLLTGNMIVGSGSMVLLRRSAIDKVGLFNERFKIGEDWEMWLRISHDYAVDFVPEYLAAVRVHGQSMQQDGRKMGEGLVALFDAVNQEMALSANQRRLLAGYCLREAAHNFYLINDPRASVAMRRLLKEDPARLLYVWGWFGYARILLGRSRTQKFKHLLLGSDVEQIAAGVKDLDHAHELYVTGDSKARAVLISVLRRHPRFLLYLTKWLLYLKLFIGRGAVKRIKLSLGKGETK